MLTIVHVALTGNSVTTSGTRYSPALDPLDRPSRDDTEELLYSASDLSLLDIFAFSLMFFFCSDQRES